MKRTLQVVTAVLALACASVTAQAQGGGGGGGGGGRGAGQRAALFEGITLTAEQTIKIDTAYAQARTAQMALGIQQGTPPTDEQRAKMNTINADRTKAIKAILTAEQNVIFDENVKKMPAGRGRGTSTSL